jgi:hypothetical protein
MARALLALGALALPAIVFTEAHAQASAVDPAATQILKRMTDYLGNLKQFSLHTQVTVEDLLTTGQRIDEDVSASMTVSRPNRIRAERKGGLNDQNFYYDGKTLTLYNARANAYGTEPAPPKIEGLIDYARESLGLIIPASDLVYPNAYQLLMQDVTFAVVVGKAVIGRLTCDHLLFSRPGVDFQVWVADAGRPLPCKYVVTDRGNPGRVSITTVMSDWNVSPEVTDARFTFVPPKGARRIGFMPLGAGDTPSR